MTLKDIKDTLIHLGFEETHENWFMNKTGKIEVFLDAKATPIDYDCVVIRRFANSLLFGRNLPEVEECYYAEEINAIYKNGNKIIFKLNKARELALKENKKGEDMVIDNKKSVQEADSVKVNYIFEINTNNNIRFITLTDFTRSKNVSYAEYYVATKEWDGDKRSVNDIMSVLMSNKLNIDKFEDGFVEVYSNGKIGEFK